MVGHRRAHLVESQTQESLGIGWRWVKGLTAIVAGANLLMMLLFAPETRFTRVLQASTTPETTTNVPLTEGATADKHPGAIEEEHVHYRSQDVEHQEVPKPKSTLQILSLWSGTPENVNIFEVFLRPLLLICYPTVLWATLACEFN